jgi:hypothetical protein
MKYQGGLIHDDKWLSIIRDDWVVVVLNYEGYSKGEMIERERESLRDPIKWLVVERGIKSSLKCQWERHTFLDIFKQGGKLWCV